MTTTETLLPSPIGALRLVATPDALVGVYFTEHRGAPPSRGIADLDAASRHPVLALAARELSAYFRDGARRFTVPVDARGTTFQREVWQALREIPYGARWSYVELARRIGRASASRAVGAANARNPLSIVVPCHRVVGASGALTGYAGGVRAKAWLIAHELRTAQGSTPPAMVSGDA